jgi:lipopolysaccharide biosynthesis glycosyltransferase
LTDRIWVAFGCDAGFAPHVAATIASIVRKTPAHKLHFLMMQDGFDEDQIETLQAVAPAAEFTWISMADFQLPEYQVSNHISSATLFRLGLEQLAPETCKRLIYLDADLIVIGNLEELWNLDLQGASIGGAPDPGLSKAIPVVDPHWERWAGDEDAPYMNAGVMLIDLEQVRRERGFSRALELIAQHGGELPYQDQDAINWIYWKKWTPLPLQWNVQRFQLLKMFQQYMPPESEAALRDPKIIHFTGPEKPWNMEGYHPWWWVYWDALSRTPYLSEVCQTNRISRSRLLHIWLRWLKRRPFKAWFKASLPGAIFKL